MEYSALKSQLQSQPRKWVVTGCAGFIGSHLTETLLNLGQQVVGLDNFATGYEANLLIVKARVGGNANNFTFIRGDIVDASVCEKSLRKS